MWIKSVGLGMIGQVCGLKWSPDGRQLASGGNDNRLNIWQDMGTVPLHSFREHQAAVKAIAWSPHQVRPNPASPMPEAPTL